MTAKDFKLIAKVLRSRYNLEDKQIGERYSAQARETLRCVAIEMADQLQLTHPKFDRARFIEACGVEDRLPEVTTVVLSILRKETK